MSIQYLTSYCWSSLEPYITEMIYGEDFPSHRKFLSVPSFTLDSMNRFGDMSLKDFQDSVHRSSCRFSGLPCEIADREAKKLEKPETLLHARANRLLRADGALCWQQILSPVGKKRNIAAISHTMAAVRRSRCSLSGTRLSGPCSQSTRTTCSWVAGDKALARFSHRKKLRASARAAGCKVVFNSRARCVFAYAARALFFYTYDIDLGPLLHKLK